MELPADNTAALRKQLRDQETALLAQRQRTIQLRHEYQKALTEDGAARSAILNGLTLCAAKECLQISDLMYQKLPSELRDLVYQFLCIENQVIPVGPYHHYKPYDPTHSGLANDIGMLATGLARGRVLEDHSERPNSTLLMPDSHIFNVAYMGPHITHEAVKAYLTINTFSICDVENGISEFLHRPMISVSNTGGYRMLDRRGPMTGIDRWESYFQSRGPGPWNYELVQPRDYVRKLQIRVKHEHNFKYLMTYREHTTNTFHLNEMFADECHFLRHSKTALGILQHLPQRTQPLELEFIIMTDGLRQETALGRVGAQGSRQFINLLQALRNTFYGLMYDSKNTKIKIIHHDDEISPFPRDITLLWSLTKEQWEHEKAANRDKSTWDADFYLAPSGLRDGETHAGFRADEEEALLRERWGIEDVFKDKKPKWPIQEGRYWPVGNGSPGWL